MITGPKENKHISAKETLWKWECFERYKKVPKTAKLLKGTKSDEKYKHMQKMLKSSKKCWKVRGSP